MNEKTALIFDIYRGTSHDGPGQRGTVFFKGCPLSCAWCHNPEGISPASLVWWQARSCIGCLQCQEACPTGACQSGEEGIHIDRVACTACGACVRACPAKAMTFSGESWTLEALVREVLRDKPYYDQTGGGVTASGGEAMEQAPFVSAFFQALRAQGVTTALDTCGLAGREGYEAVLPHTDYVLYDLKLLDSAAHRSFTGAGNGPILENLRWLAGRLRSGAFPSELWVRTPLIPGATDGEENLRGIGRFLKEQVGEDVAARWELCTFNNSCLSKYQRLGLEWPYAHTRALSRAQAESCRAAACSSGFDPERILVTGLLSD